MVIVNNEFFDALPILKFIYKNGGWREILIDIQKENEEQQNKLNFNFTESEINSPNVLRYLQPESTFAGFKIKEGDTYELSPERNIYKYNCK